MATAAQKSAIERLCNINYHQSLWLPDTANHGRLRVTFATSRNFDDETLPVLLLLPPQFCSRYHAIHLDHIAEAAGARLLAADRPGMGGSSPVDDDIRLQVWLETFPLLLEKTRIKHVSLLCHSAGALYLLSTLYHFRDSLEPEAPAVALIAPWVPASKSKTVASTILSYLPADMIKAQHSIARVINVVSPSIEWSSTVSAKLVSISMPVPDSDTASEAAERYGCDNETAKEMSKIWSQYVWAEDTKAMNNEALVLLHKTEPGSWGVCEDYAQLIRDLAKRELERKSSTKLKVYAYFAESDELIGKKGARFLEECFSQPDIPEVIDFESHTCVGTDHNSIISDLHKGAIVEVIRKLSSRGSSS